MLGDHERAISQGGALGFKRRPPQRDGPTRRQFYDALFGAKREWGGRASLSMEAGTGPGSGRWGATAFYQVAGSAVFFKGLAGGVWLP